MNVRRTLALAIIFVMSCALVAWADDPKPGGAQTGIGYMDTVHCDSKVGLADFGASFFGSGQGLQELLDGLFQSCLEFKALNTAPDKIVVFLAKPTPAAEQGTVAHFIYNHANPVTPGFTTLPGIASAAWVYVTEDEQDSLVSQLTTTAVDNPIFAQLGSLASTVGGKIVDLDAFAMLKSTAGGVPQTAPPVHKLRLLVAKSVDLKARRGTIAEADYISSPKRDSDGNLVDKDGKPSKTPVFDQIGGTFSLTNTPKTWLTVDAGVGFFAGKMHGERAKVDNKAYASDPLPAGLTMAGTTFHVPYHSDDPEPGWSERTGWFVSAVLTPAAGIATGFSVGVRGIAFTVGYALMRIDVPPAGKAPGNPVDDGVDPQLAKGAAHSWFAGASYAFK